LARRGSRGFSFDAGSLIANVDGLDRRVDAAIGAVMERSADAAVAHMKVNAPWTDRTGNARSGLGSIVFKQAGRWVMNLFGRANYQIWLEVKNGGKYAIITPTIIQWGPRTMAMMTGLIERLRAAGRV
jgi:hypothetical protein